MTDTFTSAVLDARRRAVRVPLPESLPETREEAFAAQIETLEALGLGVAGFKVGAQGRDGVPTAAPLPTGTVAEGRTVITPTADQPLWLEAELAFVVGQDLPSRETPYTPDDVLAAMAGVAAAMEIVQPRLLAWPEVPPLAALADFSANGGTVVSPVGAPAKGLHVEELTVEFRMGEVAMAVPGTQYPGQDAIRLVVWLANNMGLWGQAMRERGLRAGDVLITGSWNGVVPVVPGTTATTTIPGIGSVEVEIANG